MIARLAALVMCAVAPAAALAESIASSAASSASITASAASESLGASSNSARSVGNTARAGDYRIEAVTAADAAGKVQLSLEPLAATTDGRGFVLTLPQAALDAQRVARGDTVRVRERAYGFEFARADTGEAFFLVLADAWHRELDPRPVNAPPRAAL